MVRATLANAMKSLPGELFINIHRSFVVSVLHINNIHKDHVEVPGAPKAGSQAVLGGVDEAGECDRAGGCLPDLLKKLRIASIKGKPGSRIELKPEL